MFCLTIPPLICISVRDLYISRIGLPILLQETCGPILEYIKIAHRHMNVVGTEAAQFPGAIHKWDFLCSVQTTYCGTLCKNTTSLCHKSLKIRKNSHTRRNCGFIKGSKGTLYFWPIRIKYLLLQAPLYDGLPIL
jgi:hypothetical protein